MWDIKSMTYEELQEWVILQGEKKFRASQLYDWIRSWRLPMKK